MTTPSIKKTLGLTGVTVNAMALIAPGAFLWMTFQLQAANVDASGKSTAGDMWTGIVVALIVAFLTAISFAELARKYPDAGSGSAYYFTEKAFLDRGKASHRRWARIAKFITGWAAHLFYWVYPGVMVAFFAILVSYILNQFGWNVTVWGQILLVWMFTTVVGLVAVRGIIGSTTVSIVINVIQLTSLIVFSVLAISFRLQNPLNITPSEWYHPTANSIITPHNLSGMLFQSTIAILILVGFESSTALAAEAKNPRRDIPRGVILSLVIQGLFAYLLEYFAANYALSSRLVSVDGSLSGIAAAAASSAPIGDMAIQIGDAFLGGNGFAFMLVIAATVGLAILGTTLAAMNTAVRISFAMAQDAELPEVLGLLHEKYATPSIAVIILVIFTGIIGTIGVSGGVVALTGITLASNLGTFVLYALICGLTFVAFAGTADFNSLKHAVIPLMGFIANVVMLLSIFIIGLFSGGTTTSATAIALIISFIWLFASSLYFLINSTKKGKPILTGSREVIGGS